MAWDYIKEEYAKQQKADPVWNLERRLLYGLEGEKLNREEVKKHLRELHIPEDRKAFFEVLLWNKPF
ncbi:MAG: hypothetical protein G01um101470_262 [Parcubacteria group bacterium Gr01-1014_70]|nr:MAG: hypothetical protein G01um101470_262 [Parcubacteria group bacterium Gr01-1014_70]